MYIAYNLEYCKIDLQRAIRFAHREEDDVEIIKWVTRQPDYYNYRIIYIP